ncbi:hypothetical protein MXL46_11180 [Heyndrickxia sporothermodurans]|uniref:Zn finger protein HypA/HybF involved in hydrogenase expression n=1 Tax=Siminovitchia thermophila TaxID=1245522 RepID=A0ABS2R6W3_9BACI|nr:MULTISPECIES: hypothetical protein [Bacillaceae]MBM7715386.1 Zn finger protein HypA/HybF involved in hydrogenase expression [Siminovitchia thermophila]MEB6549648.1 hypothetical protein [Heyndrickxia sporothermodurans]
MRVITVTCDSCDKESFVKEDDFALFCPFCGSRSNIYYKPETWVLKSEKLKEVDFRAEE